ncbi:hypothetical protein LXL04_035755 [Taraxacum kok-saghyz]
MHSRNSEYMNHDPYGRQMAKIRDVTENIVRFYRIVIGLHEVNIWIPTSCHIQESIDFYLDSPLRHRRLIIGESSDTCLHNASTISSNTEPDPSLVQFQNNH